MPSVPKWWPECGMESGSPEARRAARRLQWLGVGFALATGAAVVGASRILDATEGLGTLPRALISLLPLPLFLAMLGAFVRVSRFFDEFAIRIQFEALAMTVVATCVLLFTWGQLQEAAVLPLLEMSLAWPAVPLLYSVSMFIAHRRYR